MDKRADTHLQEVHEVLLGGLGVADEVGGDGGQERELSGGVQAGDLLVVLSLEGIVPCTMYTHVSTNTI